jgi:hypothetical protein
VTSAGATCLLVLSGCGLVLDVQAKWDASAHPDVDRIDAGAARDAIAARDSIDDDADAPGDAGFSGCAPALPGDLLALYRFDGDAADSLGAGPTGYEAGPLAYIDTSSECGDVLTFFPRTEPNSGYVELPSSALWRVREGAIDLRVRLDELPSTGSGILSRDAAGASTTESGHLTLYVARSGQLAVRMQDDTDMDEALCTEEPLPIGEWVHVGINFGATAEMFVDGRRATFLGDLDSGDRLLVLECVGTLAARPLDGNDEPWVIGGSSWRSTAGSSTPIVGPLVGAVDHLRFWRNAVDFSAL